MSHTNDGDGRNRMSQGNLAELLRPVVSGPVLNDFGQPIVQSFTAEDIRKYVEKFPGPMGTKRTIFETSNFALAEAEVGLEVYRKRLDGSWIRGVEFLHTDTDWKAIQWCKEWMLVHDAAVVHLEGYC